MSPQATQIDVRRIAPMDRHPLIFTTFENLPEGQALELVNDHDPQPLRHHFQRRFPGRFAWDYLEAGPATWRVAITRQAPPDGHGQCCGSCGGA